MTSLAPTVELSSSETPQGSGSALNGCVIVLDYNRPDLTEACVRSVIRSSRLPIIVVENGDIDPKSILPPGVKCIINPTNLGFAGGMNVGIRAAFANHCDFAILLNNDARANSGVLQLLSDCLLRHPSVAIVTPRRGPRFRSIRRSAVSNTVGTTETFGRDELPPRLIDVKRVTGFCMAVRLSSLVTIGLLDEDFFFGREDDELSHRVLLHRYRLVELDGVSMEHDVSKTSDPSQEAPAAFLSYHFSRGELILARKTSRSRFLAACRAASEICKISMKGLIKGHYLPVRVVVSGLTGIRQGSTMDVKPPPRLTSGGGD